MEVLSSLLKNTKTAFTNLVSITTTTTTLVLNYLEDATAKTLTLPAVTTAAAGVMVAADKTKLDKIKSTTFNVNSDSAITALQAAPLTVMTLSNPMAISSNNEIYGSLILNATDSNICTIQFNVLGITRICGKIETVGVTGYIAQGFSTVLSAATTVSDQITISIVPGVDNLVMFDLYVYCSSATNSIQVKMWVPDAAKPVNILLNSRMYVDRLDR